MSQKTNAGAATPSGMPATQEAMATAERAFLNELVQLMPAWYDCAGPGVDVAFYGVEQLVTAADKAAVAFDDDEDDTAIPARWAALEAMRGALPIAWPQTITRRRELRKEMLKHAGDTDGTSYERRTVTLIAADILTWYTKAGLWGVLPSLYETCERVREVFNEIADDSTVPEEKKFFVAAFEARRRLGKVSDAELQALETLSVGSTTAAT